MASAQLNYPGQAPDLSGFGDEHRFPNKTLVRWSSTMCSRWMVESGMGVNTPHGLFVGSLDGSSWFIIPPDTWFPVRRIIRLLETGTEQNPIPWHFLHVSSSVMGEVRPQLGQGQPLLGGGS